MNLPFVALARSHLQDTFILLRVLIWDSVETLLNFLTSRFFMLSLNTRLAFGRSLHLQALK